jgi:predicted amidohydrolase
MQSAPLEMDENLKKAEGLVEQVLKEGAELVVLPEMFSVGFHTTEKLMDLAESLEKGKTIDWLRSMAERKKIYITTSFYELQEGHYYNTMVMVGSDGELQYYRKRNPTWMEFTVWKRSELPGPGVFETPFGRIGGAICFDSFAEETYLGFKKCGVDLVIIVACWGLPVRPRQDLFWAVPMMRRWSYLASQIVPQQYAAQLGVPTVFVNQSGTIPFPSLLPPPYPRPVVNFDFKFIGNSSVWSDSGQILMDGRERGRDFTEVVPLEIPAVENKSEVRRSDIRARYLGKDYYFVQPPFMAKLGQAWSYRTYHKEYERRRTRHNR